MWRLSGGVQQADCALLSSTETSAKDFWGAALCSIMLDPARREYGANSKQDAMEKDLISQGTCYRKVVEAGKPS